MLGNIKSGMCRKAKVRRKVWALEEKYMDFTLKRMFIFNELVKRYWKGTLNTASDLRNWLYLLKINTVSGRWNAFIKNHIRIAMGRNPEAKMASTMSWMG